jgi:hypothetical protein
MDTTQAVVTFVGLAAILGVLIFFFGPGRR